MRLPRGMGWYVEVALIVLFLVVVGIVRFSSLTPAQQREVEIRAGLEQLCHLEADHFLKHRRYFDPAAPEYRAYLKWMDEYACDVRGEGTGFSVVLRADLDGDGQMGVWRADETSPEVRRLVDD